MPNVAYTREIGISSTIVVINKNRPILGNQEILAWNNGPESLQD
jgi:hypothetical protein